MTREEVLEFARKYDPQPFHLSDEAAATTHFGWLAATGRHTCAMTMAVIARASRRRAAGRAGSPGFDELRWLKPVYPGDRYRPRPHHRQGAVAIEARPRLLSYPNRGDEPLRG